MTDTLFVRRALIGAISVCLLAGLLAAAVVGGGDKGGDGEWVGVAGSTTSSPTETDATASSVVAGDAIGGGTAPAGNAPATTSPGTATTAVTAAGQAAAPADATSPPTTAAPPPASAEFAEMGSVDDGVAVTTPKPGLYTYTVEGGDQPTTGTTRYDDKGTGPSGRNFVVTIKGMGLDSTSDVVWGSADVKVTKTQIQFGAQNVMCDWEPDHVELQLPLKKGMQWTSSSSCTVGTALVKRTATTSVVDARKVRVAGRELVAWVLDGTEKIEVNGQVQEARGTTWFSGAHGVIVRSVIESPQGRRETKITDLQPAP